jgi:hypothetical protein
MAPQAAHEFSGGEKCFVPRPRAPGFLDGRDDLCELVSDPACQEVGIVVPDRRVVERGDDQLS